MSFDQLKDIHLSSYISNWFIDTKPVCMKFKDSQKGGKKRKSIVKSNKNKKK